MSLSTQPYKGARDFYPADKRLQSYIFGELRRVVESFGYEEYDAPILEPLDIYLAKSGEEIVNEQTYSFVDRGGRNVAIRPEMTPTVSRMVAARRQELVYPLRWYSIPNLWRYERPQKGRLREHWQLNVDLFGVVSEAADIEIIQVVDAIMQRFAARRDMYKIRLNDRRFVDFLLHSYLGFDTVQAYSVAKLIDKMHKISRDKFVLQLDALCTPSQRERAVVEQLLDVLAAKRFGALAPKLQQHDTITSLQRVLSQLHDYGIKNAEFDASLMRGFDYYTGTVFEVFDSSPDNTRSLFGGGRYDGLVGLFGVEPLPTVGFGMGDVTLQNFLTAHELLPLVPPTVDLYAVIIGDALTGADAPLTELRSAGVRVSADISGRDMSKQLKSAGKSGVPYALIIGKKELASGQFTLKDLRSGYEESHGISRIISIVKDYRQQDNLGDDGD